ncbi:hypothetical protein BD779DRAFT_707048 [Infundibulicybe gibba]|nr:hypothetical protein BD779DRAFT_707048 [Infundibulicybe gibba]
MLPLLAAATAVPRTTTPTTPASQCIAGNLQCCQSTEEASDVNIPGLETLIAPIITLTGQVGLTCSPISLIGVGANSCAAKPVCCSNNSFKGLIALSAPPSTSISRCTALQSMMETAF